MIASDFNGTIDFWIQALEEYSYRQLVVKPSAASWSAGQMYMHLIADTNYYIKQIEECLHNNKHAKENASPAAIQMFVNNAFPDEVIEGAPGNAHMPQPGSKEQLLKELLQLKNDLINAKQLIETSLCKGKTKHPGLQYFSASQWLQFADMHLRHHERQKKRIDEFLLSCSVF